MIPSLLITTSGAELEKSIEKGEVLSGRLNAVDGTNHLVDSLAKGHPIEHAHKAFGPMPTQKKPPRADDTPEVAAPQSDDRTKDQKVKESKKSLLDVFDDLVKACTPKKRRCVQKVQATGKTKSSAYAVCSSVKSIDESLDDLEKSCGNLIPLATDTDVPETGAEKKKRRKAEDDGVKKLEGLMKGVFVIDPTKAKKDPLLVGGHSEEFHPDADKETMEFVVSAGPVNVSDPIHNPPVTPELNGFPLAIPILYCSVDAGDSDMIKGEP